MAKLAIDAQGDEWIFERDESRSDGVHFNFIKLPAGSIKKLTGRKLKRGNEPIDLDKLKNDDEHRG